MCLWWSRPPPTAQEMLPPSAFRPFRGMSSPREACAHDMCFNAGPWTAAAHGFHSLETYPGQGKRSRADLRASQRVLARRLACRLLRRSAQARAGLQATVFPGRAKSGQLVGCARGFRAGKRVELGSVQPDCERPLILALVAPCFPVPLVLLASGRPPWRHVSFMHTSFRRLRRPFWTVPAPLRVAAQRPPG